MTGARISYFLWQHVPIKFRSLFVLLWLIFKVIENGAEVIAGKIDLTVLHKCQQRRGDTFREVTIRALTGKARRAHILYPLDRLTPARGISKTMPKMRCYLKRDSGPDCSTTLTDVLNAACEDGGRRSLGSWRSAACGGPWGCGLRQAEGDGPMASPPSRGNVKGVKNLHPMAGNSGHMNSITRVVARRVTLHQRPLERRAERWWDGGCGLSPSPQVGPPLLAASPQGLPAAHLVLPSAACPGQGAGRQKV